MPHTLTYAWPQASHNLRFRPLLFFQYNVLLLRLRLCLLCLQTLFL